MLGDKRFTDTTKIATLDTSNLIKFQAQYYAFMSFFPSLLPSTPFSYVACMINEYVFATHENIFFLLISNTNRFDIFCSLTNLHFNHFFRLEFYVCKFLQPAVHDKQQRVRQCCSASLFRSGKSISVETLVEHKEKK